MTVFLQAHGVSTVTQLQKIDELPQLIGPGDPPRFVIVHIDPNPAETLSKLAPLIRSHPSISFFVMSSVLETTLVLDAMHIGVKEFVPLPVNQQKFLTTLERVMQVDGMEKRATVIHFIPTSGGCGPATVACHIAASLAQNMTGLLIDLDLVRGNAEAAFDV